LNFINFYNRTPARAATLALLSLFACPQLWACAVFAPPRQYQNPAVPLQFDARPQALALIQRSHKNYADALAAAKDLELAIESLLQKPSAKTLARARLAWKSARVRYQQTEWMRFVDGPIDWPAAPNQPAGPEARLNAWPLNEAVIDYVKGAPRVGLINQLELPLSLESILARDQTGDESDVTTGWHAIEFLLWGQDFSSTGPGNRSSNDFLADESIRERRRSYLRIVTQLLISDLTIIEQEWRIEVTDSYAERLSQLPSSEILGPALHGAASLIAIELRGERFAVALDSGMQEDEHSCFSDNTLLDLRANLAGIAAMLRNSDNGEIAPDSLLALIEWKNPELAKQLQQAMASAEAQLAAVPEPFDQLILMDAQTPARQQAETALVALQLLAVKIKASAENLGLQIVVPGV